MIKILITVLIVCIVVHYFAKVLLKAEVNTNPAARIGITLGNETIINSLKKYTVTMAVAKLVGIADAIAIAVIAIWF